MIRGKTITFVSVVFAMMLLNSSYGFVVQPHVDHTKVATKKFTMLELSSQSVEPKKSNNFLGKIANALTPWWLKHKTDTEKNVEEVDSEVILSPRQRSQTELADREMRDALQPMPWPFRAVGGSITRSINRQLSQEQRKAKPLLKDAQQLIKRDKDLLAVLGTPVNIRPIFSGSSVTSTVNWKKSKRIADRFMVEGSKKSGVATLIADKYAKGHIQSLRVDVDGVHYDIDR